MSDTPPPIENDLGHFEGFSFTRQCAIEKLLTAEEVLAYPGEAEFWPAGDNELVQALFESSTAVSPTELLTLDAFISDHGEEPLIPAIALSRDGYALPEITEELLDDASFHIFEDTGFIDARREAAHSLFELYWPDAYKLWESGSHPDGLFFDPELFLDSPQCSVTEVSLGPRRIVIVRLQ